MELQERVNAVISRTKAFYRATEGGHFLVNVNVATKNYPPMPLYDYDPATRLTEWLDGLLAWYQTKWQSKTGIEDDSVPCICPRFGIAEHSAWLGMKVIAQEATNLPVPILKSLDEIDKLTLSEKTNWFGYMKNSYEYLRSKNNGTFVLSIRGTMSPMDMANAVRGNEIFVEVLTEPKKVHQLMKFLTEAIRWYFNHLRSWADEICGGYFLDFGGIWLKDPIGHLSNDMAMLCSTEIYKQFGYPYEAELVKDYKSVLYHVHNEKLHFIPQLVKLPNLALLEIAQDPKTNNSLEDLSRIFRNTGNVNLLLSGNSDQVRTNIEQLKARNVFLFVQCNDRADAEDIVSFTRSHSKPL